MGPLATILPKNIPSLPFGTLCEGSMGKEGKVKNLLFGLKFLHLGTSKSDWTHLVGGEDWRKSQNVLVLEFLSSDR